MTSATFYLLSSIFIILATAWLIIIRHKKSIKPRKYIPRIDRRRVTLPVKVERRITANYQQIKQHLRSTKHLKHHLIQSLWSLCDESIKLGLIDTMDVEQFNMLDNGRIILSISWQAKNDAASQLTLRRLIYKHAETAAAELNLSLQNVHCNALKLELTFADEHAAIGVMVM
jgi:hypothetical protein